MGLAALFQPLLAQAQAQTPAPAPAAPSASPAAPADPSISDRVKKDAASPLYWIRLNAQKNDAAAPAKQAPRIVEVKPVAAAPRPVPAPAPAGGGGAVATTAPPTAVANPAAAAAATTAANTSAGTAQAPTPAPVAAPITAAATPATSVQATGGAAAGLAAGAGLAAPSAASPATEAARTATAPVEEPDDSPLALVKADEPEFPITVMRRLRKGTVQVRFDVLTDGSVGNVTVVGTTHRSLNEAALEAVNTWRFQPVRAPRTAVVDLGFDLDS